MKVESDPITEDELLIRLVWHDRVTSRVPIISPNSFEPRRNEAGGISLYRRACLADPADALIPIAADKRSRYAIVALPVGAILELGLSVRQDPSGHVPGHVTIPELNFHDYNADKARFTPIKLRLAEIASERILRLPQPS